MTVVHTFDHIAWTVPHRNTSTSAISNPNSRIYQLRGHALSTERMSPRTILVDRKIKPKEVLHHDNVEKPASLDCTSCTTASALLNTLVMRTTCSHCRTLGKGGDD